MTPTEALIQVLVQAAELAGMGHHSYIVGGAPRDHMLGHGVKDVDVVVEPRDGKDASTLAEAFRAVFGPGAPKCHPDQYGVVHLGPLVSGFYEGVSLVGQKVEIVTTRKEKYDRSRKKDSHKPSEVAVGTILEDLERRDFTINTLAWRLCDLADGIEGAPVLDLLGRGLEDLRNGTIQTPLDPYQTFEDDPSRMLRAVRFCVKYNFGIEQMTYMAIQAMGDELKRLPYEAIDGLFFDKILRLDTEKVKEALTVMASLHLIVPVRELIPAARQKRAIKERIQNVDLLLELANQGFNIGLDIKTIELRLFIQARQELSEDELTALFDRYRQPLDTMRFMEVTGAQGPTVGVMVQKARHLTLLRELSPDQIFHQLVQEYSGDTA